MEWKLWLQGLLLGFSIAAPVGPIGVLCIRRTLAQGRLTGLVSGLGAATADACYGAVAALGLSLVSGFLVSQQVWLRAIGGLFLIYLGVKTLLATPAGGTKAGDGLLPVGSAAERRSGLLGAYASTFVLTLSNPATILSFAAIFAGLGAVQAGSGIWLVAGVFCGSALWWLTLSGLVGLVRSRLTPRAMLWVNRLSGVCITGFGLAVLISILTV